MPFRVCVRGKPGDNVICIRRACASCISLLDDSLFPSTFRSSSLSFERERGGRSVSALARFLPEYAEDGDFLGGDEKFFEARERLRIAWRVELFRYSLRRRRGCIFLFLL